MEHDDIIIGLTRVQASQDEILRLLEDFKSDVKETKEDLQEVRKYMYYAGGALSVVSVSWPFVWDYIKTRLGISS